MGALDERAMNMAQAESINVVVFNCNCLYSLPRAIESLKPFITGNDSTETLEQ